MFPHYLLEDYEDEDLARDTLADLERAFGPSRNLEERELSGLVAPAAGWPGFIRKRDLEPERTRQAQKRAVEQQKRAEEYRKAQNAYEVAQAKKYFASRPQPVAPQPRRDMSEAEFLHRVRFAAERIRDIRKRCEEQNKDDV